jgi:hypothetical protein
MAKSLRRRDVTQKKIQSLTPFHHGEGLESRYHKAFFIQALGTLISIFGFALSLTCLYLAMRGAMRLGGMVAAGGPYQIAHPAPGWIWLFPASMCAGTFFVFLNLLFARRTGGLNLPVLVWPAAFVSLGWNFLEFGLHPPGQASGVSWGWLVCGVVFVLMGGSPLVFLIKNAVQMLPGQVRSAYMADWQRDMEYPDRSGRIGIGRIVRIPFLALQLAAVGFAILLAVRLFERLSG